MTERTKSLARIGLLSVACLFVAHVVMAQDFWVKKEFNQWSDDELKKFMTDSPWVKKVEVPRSTGPDTTIFWTATFAWESSLPVKWANVRTKMGKPGDVPADAKQLLEQPANAYAIRLSGMPVDMVAAIQGDSQAAKGSILKIGKREIPLSGLTWAAAAAPSAGRAPVSVGGGIGGRGGRGGGAPADAAAGGDGAPRGAGGRGAARGADFYLIFPMDNPIELEEGDSVEVLAKFGSLKISKVFKLKDMALGGKLVL